MPQKQGYQEVAWVECRGLWGKGQERVSSAVHHIAQRLPFPLLGLDSGNDSEFINQHLYTYCQRNQITLHPLPALQEERQRSCGAKELAGDTKTGGIRPLHFQGCPRATMDPGSIPKSKEDLCNPFI